MEGRHQEGSEDDDDDDNNDPDMGDTLNLECTKNIMSSKIKNSIHHGFQISQDLPSRRKEKVTDDTAITESDNDVFVPKDNKMFQYIEGTDEEEDTGSNDEWHPESFSIDAEEEEDSDHKGGPVAYQKFLQLTNLSVDFYLMMVAVSSGSRLTSMQVKSQK